MERKVIFRDGMDADPNDFNNLQNFAQTSSDHVVGDGISSDRKFAGFAVAQLSATEIEMQPGRLYSNGVRYVLDTSYSRNFLTSLPVATKKHMLLVVFGQEVETDARSREYLIDELTRATETKSLPMEVTRLCNVNIVAGQESADPIDPTFDIGAIAVARVILTPAGIDAIEMIEENRLPSVASVSADVDVLKDVQAKTGPKIASLDSDLAALKAASAGNVNIVAYGRTLERLAVLEAKNGVPSAATDSAAFYYLDTDGSDLAFVGSNCKVQEGVRFADINAAEAALTLFEPLNPNAKNVGGTLFPTYTLERRLTSGPRQGELQAASLTYQTHEMVQKTMSRTRIRYGSAFTVCTNAGWWGAITDQYIPRTFQRDGETFQVLDVDWDGPTHGWVRLREYWYDTYDEPYWEAVTVDHTVPGTQTAETFLNANDMWLASIGLTFSRLAAEGNATIAICETDRGMPKLDSAISVTTLLRADMKLNQETVIPIQPTFLKGGQRYAILVITAGDHWLATTGGANFPSGTLFTVLDGAYQQGDGTRDLCFSLYACKFAQARAIVRLNDLQLAGGISDIDILADCIEPASCDLTFEIQVDGNWYPLDRSGSVLGAGGSIPPVVPLRAIFTGTTDVMPAVRLTGSKVRVSRSATNLLHVSPVRTLPGAGSAQIRVIARYEAFDPAHHTATCKLRTGAGYATVVAPTSFTDIVNPDGSRERTFIFNLGAAVTSFRYQLEATTDSALLTFHHAWTKYFAL
ncbi:MAG: hypothetical protein ACOY5R_10750 [Pseudomonadota bacterium]